MIIVRFTSGLGNQMYQYNLYSMLKDKYPETRVLADLSWFSGNAEHQGFELLKIFPNAAKRLQIATDFETFICSGRIPNRLKGRAAEIWQYILRIPHRLVRTFKGREIAAGRIEQTGFEDNAEIYKRIMEINPENNYYITGFFIEEIYYKDRLPKLREEFDFIALDEDDKNNALLNKIHGGYSVSIHVRRGDYLSDKYNTSFISLPMDYYKIAVDMVKKEHPDAHFYIFSDDKEYINSAFTWLSDYETVNFNTGKDSFRDMQLMKECRANITANSTFSQWAGLLNANEDAKVYYPGTYMRQKDSEVKTLSGWIRI